jgi:hypothetical protein
MSYKTVYKMFKVFCNVKFCTFCMFLYVYDLFHILLSCDKMIDPGNVCMYDVCIKSIGFFTLGLCKEHLPDEKQ